MADNVDADTGVVTAPFATDEIGGIHYPRTKFGFGVDGAYADVSSVDPLPIIQSGPGSATYTSIPDNAAPASAFRLVGQDIWNCSFSGVGASVLSPELNTPIVGTGVGYSQAGGALLVTSGTTANAEFLTRSIRSWRSSMMLSYSAVMSQRIANNNFAYILADLIGEGLAVTINSATNITVAIPGHTYTAQNVGQFMFVGGIVGAAGVPGRYAIASVVPGVSVNFTVAGWPASGSCTATLFGHSHYKHIYNGTVATNMLVNSQRRGWADADTTPAINTTASPGHIVKTHIRGRSVEWQDILRASTLVPFVSTRASRVENLPDDNLDLYLFLWSYNGPVAPATTTTWTISFCSVEKFAAVPVYDQGSSAQGNSWPKPVISIGGTYVLATGTSSIGNVGPTAPATSYFVNSLATTNGALILTGTSGLQAFWATNNGAAAAYVKLYNKATAPTVGTDVPEMIIPVPAAVAGVPGVAPLPIGFSGFRFPLGLGIAITGGAADADTTAVAAGQVKVKLSRTV